MSDKASGNGTESHGDDDKGLVEGNFPDGEELLIDPYSGDQRSDCNAGGSQCFTGC
jgi:hypothetical protein